MANQFVKVPVLDLSNIDDIPYFSDDLDAGNGGLQSGDLYQTDGNGLAPLNVAGILMVKQ